MALENLAPDQRAVIQLVLQQGRSYAALAGLLGISEDAVRQRAHAGLATVGGTGTLSPEDQGRVADFLLGQQDDDERFGTEALLAGSSEARAWAESVAAALAPVARNGLPEIPSGGGSAAVDAGPAIEEDELEAPGSRRRAAEEEPATGRGRTGAAEDELDEPASRRRGRAAAAEPADDELDEPTSRRGRRRAAEAADEATSGRGRRGGADGELDGPTPRRGRAADEEPSEDELDEPASRRRSRGGDDAPAARRRRRGADEEPAADDEESTPRRSRGRAADEARRRRPERDRPRRAGATAADDDEQREGAPPASRLGGGLLIAGLAILLVGFIGWFAFLRGNDDAEPTTTTASTPTPTAQASPQAQVIAQLPMRGVGGSKAEGLVQINQTQERQIGFTLVARNVDPNTERDAYAVWLTGKGRDPMRLGFAARVGEDRTLATSGPEEKTDPRAFTQGLTQYGQMVVSRETDDRVTEPTTVVLRASLNKLRQAAAEGAGGGGEGEQDGGG